MKIQLSLIKTLTILCLSTTYFSCEDSTSELIKDENPFSIYAMDQNTESLVQPGFDKFANTRLEDS